MYDIASIYSARSVDDAIRALQADPAAVVIAGGTDVLIKIREGKLAGCPLVSIHELGEELSGVTLADNGDVEIGPLTTFRGVTFSDVIRRTIPVLGEAADMAGGPQLRAAGTIGGNVCNGITSADTASTLVALDAVLRVRGPKGEREVPISQVFADNTGCNDLFYTGRFDFVVYMRQGEAELPVLAIELDGKEHLEDAAVMARDRKKEAICAAHHLQMIRVENSYARRYNYMKDILISYFSRTH